MLISNLADRETTESAKKLKTVATSPLQYQMMLDEIFSLFDLDEQYYAVIPFAYDGTSWMAATAHSKIRIGSLNNEYTPWTTMLYVLRDNPLFMYDEMKDAHVDSVDYQMHLNLMNMFMIKLAEAKENDRRRFDEDDIYVCASRWLTIADAADWSKGSIFDQLELVNQFKGENKTLHLNKTKQYFEDLSSRLDGAFICDLEPFVHATMLLQHEEGLYSREETLWIFTPEPHDLDKGARMIAQFAPILHERGGKFIAILPESHSYAYSGLGDGESFLPGIQAGSFCSGKENFIILTNLDSK